MDLLGIQYGDVRSVTGVRDVDATVLDVERPTGGPSVRLLSAARILFGSIFFFDGLLKWYLFQQGQMQAVIQGFGVGALSAHWVLVGVLVGLGETTAGLCLALGIFQRPAAIGAAAIMTLIWVFGGYGGYGLPGYTDLGGDLMLALIFGVLAFAPTAYGLAARWQLPARWPTHSIRDRLLRTFVA